MPTFDHAIRPATPEQLGYWKKLLARGWAGGRCSAKCCKAYAAFTSWYRYVTGSRGRVTTASRNLCPHHAQKFATKHGLAIPAATLQGEPHGH